LWCSWTLPHIPFSSYSKLHRELVTSCQLGEQAGHVGQGGRYHGDVQIWGPELSRSENIDNSRWLSLSVVNPMGNIRSRASIFCSKFNGKLSRIQKMQIPCGSSNFEISMCHNLCSDHFDDKSLKSWIKVSHTIHFRLDRKSVV
jgi:hypothetical protein